MNSHLEHKRVAVVGLGISNISAIGYLLKHNLKALSVFDTRVNPPYVEELPSGIDFHLGALDGKLLATFDVLVLSPGLSVNLPEIRQAADAGVKIVGDVELFAAEAKAPVSGITGSNGKSTVTALTAYMGERAGLEVAAGANFGNPVFDILNDRVQLYVLELSSFELETTYSLSLRAGVILNVSEDHLDRYDGSLDLYSDAKHRIFGSCTNIIVNRDDRRTYPADSSQPVFASFGLDDQGYGRRRIGSETWLTVNGEAVIRADEMIICGKHNELNALAAMALADAAGIPRQAQLDALRTFPGLDHRCQLVRVLDGVSFYNDSKATNVASTQAAIEGLSERHPGGIILLAGGLGKGQDFTPLARYLGHEVSAVFCFGKDAKKILDLNPVHTHSTLNMRQAMREAFAIARPGQAILLSPACASFDQFSGYEERGRVFSSLAFGLESREG